VLTREPGGTDTGEHIRTLLLDPTLPTPTVRAEVLLLLAARAQHVAEVIEPALASGRDVVCDRFVGSTIAYQGYGRGLDPVELAELSSWAARGVGPDLVVLLSVAADVAVARRAARAQADRIEGEGADFFSKVDEGFTALAAADPARWQVVDGSGSVEEVAARIAEAIGGL
jgi:dTMP kinase